MSDRFFLDTNVFVYSLTAGVPSKQIIATRLIKEAIESGKGAISFQVVQEFFSVALRRFRPPMSLIEAEQFLAMPLRPLLVVQSSFSLYWQALQLANRHSISWYDSLIVAAAIGSGCGTLYTEDIQHGQKFGDLIVRNPFS